MGQWLAVHNVRQNSSADSNPRTQLPSFRLSGKEEARVVVVLVLVVQADMKGVEVARQESLQGNQGE